jgi:hypothetical protein
MQDLSISLSILRYPVIPRLPHLCTTRTWDALFMLSTAHEFAAFTLGMEFARTWL